MDNGNVDLFRSLVRYYIENDLPLALEHFKSGSIMSPRKRSYREKEENKYIQGVLIVADGQTLADRLVSDRVILDKDDEGVPMKPVFSPVDNYTSLSSYLRDNETNDGIFFYNGSRQEIARACDVNNNPDGNEQIKARFELVSSFAHLLVPVDYIFKDSSSLTLRQLQDDTGRKTSLAIKLPVVYSTDSSNVNTYQIKQSAYGDLRMGTVNHFTSNGLKQRFLLRCDPEHTGPFMDSEYKIVGELRDYAHNGTRVVETSRRVVGCEFYKEQPLTAVRPYHQSSPSQLHVG